MKQLLKTHWLTVLLAAGLLTTSIIVFKQKKKIKHLNYEVSDLEDLISNLEDEKAELQNELDNCNSEKADYNNNSYSQSSDNWFLQNGNPDLDDLEGKISNDDFISDDDFHRILQAKMDAIGKRFNH